MPWPPPASGSSRPQLALTARGLISEAFNPAMINNNVVPTSQRVVYTLLGLSAGDVISNIVVDIETAGTGTAPTSIFVGLYTAAGARVAVSNNLNSSVIWATTGMTAAPLAATYTVPTSGGYYCAFLEDTTVNWGTTNLALGRFATTSAAQIGLSGAATFAAVQTGQSSLPTTATFANAGGSTVYQAAA